MTPRTFTDEEFNALPDPELKHFALQMEILAELREQTALLKALPGLNETAARAARASRRNG